MDTNPPRTMSRSDCIIAPCLNPPAIPELYGLPAWILLETRVYFADRHNLTTARAETSKGHAIQLSICFAHPPALSYACIHCPGLTHADYSDEPRVVCSEKQFLLLHLSLWTAGCRESVDEYYMYQAIPGKPTLSRIPPISGRSLLMPEDFGIYPCDDGEYILAGLSLTCNPVAHELHSYSSKSNVWTTKPARLVRRPMEDRLPVTMHKVILLGGSPRSL